VLLLKPEDIPLELDERELELLELLEREEELLAL
jgi:hypothetical protein